MDIKIGDTIKRTDPRGVVVTREIKSEREIEYYQDLETKGYKIEIVT
jgi:hypothetical protein